MPHPLPTQLSGARFLADRQTALLADEPRVGKTGAAIIAADLILAQTILVVTTASGRAVWRAGFAAWQRLRRTVGIMPTQADVTIVSWAEVSKNSVRAPLLSRRFDVLILDESHYAKSSSAARTVSVYGDPRETDEIIVNSLSLVSVSAAVWCLSGTPIPNTPADLFPMMRTLCPDRLLARDDLPDVSSWSDFAVRYLEIEPRKINAFEWRDQIVGGQNYDELRKRLDGFILRRTQADVGIRAPVYETLPLLVSEAVRRRVDAVDERAVLVAAEAGDTAALEMHLGSIRRLTGEIKAKAAVEAAEESLDNGLDKIVLMAWHTDVIYELRARLAGFRPVVIQGSTSPRDREAAEAQFREDAETRVAIGQIQAAGEAIDLSAAPELWFVESSFVPAHMAQAALRITNHTQRRQAFVRVCTLAGSIDEALQAVLMRKWSAIREVLK